MKLEPDVHVFEQIEFCQSHPVWTQQGYIMVLNPVDGLAKQCMSIKPMPGEKITKRWLSTIGKGGLTLAGGIPIWQNFYKHCETSGEGEKVLKNDPTMRSGFYLHFIKGMRREYAPVHPRTRSSFYLAYGISASEQIARENQILNTPKTTYENRIITLEEIKYTGTVI